MPYLFILPYFVALIIVFNHLKYFELKVSFCRCYYLF